MKKVLLVLLTLFGLSNTLVAQAKVWNSEMRSDSVPYRPYIHKERFGVKVGAGFNSLWASTLTQHTSTDFSAELFFQWVEGSTRFETGLGWINRKYDLTGYWNNPVETFKTDFSRNAISLPIKLGYQWKWGDSRDHDIYISPFIGGYLEYAIGNSHKYMKHFDMGSKIGIDIDYDRWRFGFCYTSGWLNLSDGIDRSIKTKSFDFTIGYSFHLK